MSVATTLYRRALSSPWRQRFVNTLLQNPYRTTQELCSAMSARPTDVHEFLSDYHGLVFASHDASPTRRMFYVHHTFTSWLATQAIYANNMMTHEAQAIQAAVPPTTTFQEHNNDAEDTDASTSDNDALATASPFACKHAETGGAIVFLDLDHQGHVVNQDGTVDVPAELGHNVLTVGVCGKGYRGRCPEVLYKAHADIKYAADYLLSSIVTDWLVRGHLDGRPVFIVSRDSSLANIAAIASDYYFKDDIVTVASLEDIGEAISRRSRRKR